MKEKIEKIMIDYRVPCLLIVLELIYQGLLYYFVKITPFSARIVGGGIDTSIPFIPVWVVFYVIWYPLLILTPCFLYHQDRKTYYLYLISKIIIDTIATFIFFFYPTLLIRPEFEITGIFTWVLSIVYWLDNPAMNCFPSIHCTTCFTIIFILLKSSEIKKKYRTVGIVISILIILSTLLVKQHALIDVIGAFFLSLAILWLVYKGKIHLYIQNKIEKKIR